MLKGKALGLEEHAKLDQNESHCPKEVLKKNLDISYLALTNQHNFS